MCSRRVKSVASSLSVCWRLTNYTVQTRKHFWRPPRFNPVRRSCRRSLPSLRVNPPSGIHSFYSFNGVALQQIRFMNTAASFHRGNSGRPDVWDQSSLPKNSRTKPVTHTDTYTNAQTLKCDVDFWRFDATSRRTRPCRRHTKKLTKRQRRQLLGTAAVRRHRSCPYGNQWQIFSCLAFFSPFAWHSLILDQSTSHWHRRSQRSLRCGVSHVLEGGLRQFRRRKQLRNVLSFYIGSERWYAVVNDEHLMCNLSGNFRIMTLFGYRLIRAIFYCGYYSNNYHYNFC